jgi:hypothetical protein
MNSLENPQNSKSTAAAEQLPTTQSSSSLFQRQSKSTGQGLSPQNLPPIGVSDLNALRIVESHPSKIPRDFVNHRKEKTEVKVEEDFLGEDEQAEALQALASYSAFQLQLLRHIADAPTFVEFSSQS